MVPGGDLAKVMRACCMISNSTVPWCGWSPEAKNWGSSKLKSYACVFWQLVAMKYVHFGGGCQGAVREELNVVVSDFGCVFGPVDAGDRISCLTESARVAEPRRLQKCSPALTTNSISCTVSWRHTETGAWSGYLPPYIHITTTYDAFLIDDMNHHSSILNLYDMFNLYQKIIFRHMLEASVHSSTTTWARAWKRASSQKPGKIWRRSSRLAARKWRRFRLLFSNQKYVVSRIVPTWFTIAKILVIFAVLNSCILYNTVHMYLLV